jgi:hypothetical protein
MRERVKHITPRTVEGIHQTKRDDKKFRVRRSYVLLADTQRLFPVMDAIMVVNFVKYSTIAATQSIAIETTNRQICSPMPALLDPESAALLAS